MNRTWTVWFSVDSLAAIRNELDALKLDVKARAPYISEAALEQVSRRFALLEHAIDLLSERVPE